MQRVRSVVQAHQTRSYFALAFALAWSVWIPAGALWGSRAMPVILLGAWSPTIAALALTAVLEGRAGVTSLVKRLLIWRVQWRWYLVAMLGTTALACLAMVLDVVAGGSAPTLPDIAARFGLAHDDAWLVLPLMPLIYLTTIFGGPIAEELGWRGYAQPRLQIRYGPVTAGAIIGIMWSMWHLPLFVLMPSATGYIPLAWYTPLVTGWGVLFSWLYNHARGSVLLCVLCHAGVNFAVGALGLLEGGTHRLTLFVVLTVATALATAATTVARKDDLMSQTERLVEVP